MARMSFSILILVYTKKLSCQSVNQLISQTASQPASRSQSVSQPVSQSVSQLDSQFVGRSVCLSVCLSFRHPGWQSLICCLVDKASKSH